MVFVGVLVESWVYGLKGALLPELRPFLAVLPSARPFVAGFLTPKCRRRCSAARSPPNASPAFAAPPATAVARLRLLPPSNACNSSCCFTVAGAPSAVSAPAPPPDAPASAHPSPVPVPDAQQLVPTPPPDAASTSSTSAAANTSSTSTHDLLTRRRCWSAHQSPCLPLPDPCAAVPDPGANGWSQILRTGPV
ncbi:lysine-rich arabinogalactan protein 19-like [Eucalyptus grandis]|uniref:lysine-rich arabinogalactan protein 19-like n=1 Tax=Eucalyptus grandis TaxID=71139 RepID=UPI00192F0176|nr:lysine-rich arabinogalactan protein 19-like [Eucalyptus grandis]